MATSVAVTGPHTSNSPRIIATRASEGSHSRAIPEGIRTLGRGVPAGNAPRTTGSRSVATQHTPLPGRSYRVARPARTNSSNRGNQSPGSRHGPSSPAAGIITRLSSRSCSSSAERTCGCASAPTRSIASGSSRPRSETLSTVSERRVATARVRRSATSPPSRKAYGLAFNSS